MLINFDELETECLKNFKGGEKEVLANIFNDGKNKIMRLCLCPGSTIGMHAHDTSSEIVLVLSGKGKFLTETGEEKVEAGSCHYCEKGKAHSLVNTGAEDLVIFAVVPEQ